MRKQRFAECTGLSAASLLIIVILILLSAAGAQTAQQPLPNAPSAQKAKAQSTRTSDTGWPRTMTSGADTFVIYQPQVDKWDGNRVSLYTAAELKTAKDKAPTYGVIWFSARTEVDKLNRQVTLDQVQLEKVKFPVAPEKEAELAALIKPKLPGATKTVSLDRMQASLEASDEEI